MLIYLRLAKQEELTQIMELFEQAKQLLRQDGSSQWQNGSPNQADFQDDLDANEGYVLIVDGQIGGYVALKAGNDVNYQVIREGNWHADEPYIAIHRVLLGSQFRGKKLASYLLAISQSIANLKGYSYLKIDTHPKNERMQHLIKQAGFQYCGIIEIIGTVDPKRYAYDLKLD